MLKFEAKARLGYIASFQINLSYLKKTKIKLGHNVLNTGLACPPSPDYPPHPVSIS
jgi:hypothetical protein